MAQIKVIMKREDSGMFLADPQHNFKVGLHGYGKTADEALNDLRCVWEEAQEFCPELPEVSAMEFVVKYEVASFLQEYAGLFSLAGLEKITGIHQKQLGHYLNGNKRPRPETTRKIEHALIQFRTRFDQVQFVD